MPEIFFTQPKTRAIDFLLSQFLKQKYAPLKIRCHGFGLPCKKIRVTNSLFFFFIPCFCERNKKKKMKKEFQKMDISEKSIATAKIIRSSIRRKGLNRDLFKYLFHVETLILQAENHQDPIIDVLDFFRDFMLRMKSRQLEKDSVKLLLTNLDTALNGK